MPHSGAGSRARRVACYFELLRIPLPRTRVDKGKEKGRRGTTRIGECATKDEAAFPHAKMRESGPDAGVGAKTLLVTLHLL
jgi:hypothetical protein